MKVMIDFLDDLDKHCYLKPSPELIIERRQKDNLFKAERAEGLQSYEEPQM